MKARTSPRLTSLLLALSATVFAAEPPIPPVPDKQPEPPFAATPAATFQMLVPGFTVRELPVKLTSLNNIEYAPDGRLFAGGFICCATRMAMGWRTGWTFSRRSRVRTIRSAWW